MKVPLHAINLKSDLVSGTPLYGKVFIGRNYCSGKECDSWASCLKVNKLNIIPCNFAACQ